MIEQSELSADDVLIDFGSGLGQLCIVASILTGARAIGVEIEHAYIESARECVRNLQLSRIKFLQATRAKPIFPREPCSTCTRHSPDRFFEPY